MKQVDEYMLYVHHETTAAWLCSEDPDSSDDERFWLPKSQCELIENKGGAILARCVFEIPEWLAIEKGIV